MVARDEAVKLAIGCRHLRRTIDSSRLDGPVVCICEHPVRSGFDCIGPFIEDHPIFPDRANVEFVRVNSRDDIEIRIWERGAGHTLSSGTGSCASAIAATLNGLTDRKVRVQTEGGTLRVYWRDDDRVMLTASAEVIYEGSWLRELGA